ncbi:hypothetical protein [Streptomyces flavidovirens]|uniref:hypothetical protein n=1 Tax=Streptomyces flavidovirens TaxID=67298 RepID=UPI0036CB8FBA
MTAFQGAFEALRNAVGDVDADRILTAVEAEARTEQAAEVERLRAELDAVKLRAQKLVAGWKQASTEHEAFAKSQVMDLHPGLADKQEGRSLQLLDCSDELADVLKGEDPDDWEHGIGVDVVDRDERNAAAEARS